MKEQVDLPPPPGLNCDMYTIEYPDCHKFARRLSRVGRVPRRNELNIWRGLHACE